MKSFHHIDIPCVILCGGKSSRMGEDKALLPFDGYDSLSEYQYKKLQTIFSKVYISSKENKFDFDADIIADKEKNVHSPIVALKSIFETLKENKVFIITVDTPFVKEETINKLIKLSVNYDIVIPKTERIHNLCGVFDKSSLSIINTMLQKDIHKVGYLIKNMNSFMLEMNDENEFLNLNDKNEYQKALSLLI